VLDVTSTCLIIRSLVLPFETQVARLLVEAYCEEVLSTNRWATVLTRRLAVDHGRMRSSLCLTSPR
jgi:hypothetical protein